jgi:nucleotide-binding universal stress UspA family protein
MAASYLIGLDGSAFADAALSLGLRWAKRTGAKLVGIVAVDEPGITRSEPVGVYGDFYKQDRDTSLLAVARRGAQDALDRFASRCAEAGVPYESRLQTGDPVACLTHEAADHDLTFLGRQTFFRHETQEGCDETLPQIVRGAGRPVVVVPETVPADGSVVVAYDASPPSVRALESFAASGLADGLRVTVVSVHDDQAVAERRADDAVRVLRHDGFDARPVVRVGDRQADSILGEVRESGAGLLVMGAYGRSHVREFLFSSTTARILDECPVPVFVRH